MAKKTKIKRKNNKKARGLMSFFTRKKNKHKKFQHLKPLWEK